MNYAELLTEREAAILIWVGIVTLLLIPNAQTRKALGGVIRVLLNRHIVFWFSTILIWMCLSVWLFWSLGVWGIEQLKPTLLWLIFSGPAAAFSAATKDESPNLVGKWISETLTFMVLIEFIATSWTFPVWGELLFMPFMFFISAMAVMAETKPEY